MRTRQEQHAATDTGDPWGVEQHHWNTGVKENQQLNPGRQATDKKAPAPTN